MTRLLAAEYQSSSDWIRRSAEEHGIVEEVLQSALVEASNRISSNLNLKEPALSVAGHGLDVAGVAGLVRLAPNLELEVIPKFLNPNDERWREDFFFLANLSSHGAILSRDRLRASDNARNDLASLVGKFMVDEFELLRRRPLRSYVNTELREWAIDGDLDSTEILTPEDDGFLQRRLILTKDNTFNMVIVAAVLSLLPLVEDPSVLNRLVRMRDDLSPQAKLVIKPIKRNLPNRHSHWQPLYDISVQILNGLGIGLIDGNLNSPGYVMNTWRVWEDLIRRCMTLRFGSKAVYHQRHQLGVTNGNKSVLVTPDVTVSLDGGTTVLVDAKYKGRFNFSNRISSADLYESLAFMDASRSRQTILVYPMNGDVAQGATSTGDFSVFEKIDVRDLTVIGAEIDVRNISSKWGFRKFSNGLEHLVRTHSQ